LIAAAVRLVAPLLAQAAGLYQALVLLLLQQRPVLLVLLLQQPAAA
jgi:hypothetical protein